MATYIYIGTPLMSTLSAITAAKDSFEQLVFKHDPAYADMNRALEIVKKFITDNNLIIYGGTAIDMALRMHGDKIYPDDLFPDLDFYSPNNVEHSYELADILYRAGFAEVRAINAAHMKTMRVDLVGNHFIADISFQPPELFDKIPFLVFRSGDISMRIVHPLFQRIDMHSALSFPYENAPREVIFARWAKDIKRFNMLNKYYPVKTTVKSPLPVTITIPISLRSQVFTGVTAYAFLYLEYTRACVGAHPLTNIIPATVTVTADAISITAPMTEVAAEFVHFDPAAAMKGVDDSLTMTEYEPLGSVLPERVEYTGVASTCPKYIVTNTKHKMVTVNSIRGVGVSEKAFRIVNVQPLLRHFAAHHIATGAADSLYLKYYSSVLSMIEHVEAIVVGSSDPVPSADTFFPSIQTYGYDDTSLTKQVLLNRMYAELDGTPAYVTPWNYYPGRVRPSTDGSPPKHPAFDINSSEFYRERGIAIIPEVENK